jgi:hypothetical protein
MRIFLAVLFVFHGLAHVVGFAVPWRLIDADDLPYGTTLLAGHLDVGHAGIRAVGVAWLLVGLAFVVTGVATWLSQGWWSAAATWVAIASLALSVLGWPQARIGVVLNVLILFLLLAGPSLGWLEL